jgi:alkylation response protein AidB-like acyl-CoA dehydrogenase
VELTLEQREVIAAVRDFVEREVVPTASELEHADEFTHALVATMRELGLFGVTIPEEYGGLGLDLTTYALIQVELSRGWMSLSGILNTHFMSAWMIRTFGYRRPARAVPTQDGDGGIPLRVFDDGAGGRF